MPKGEQREEDGLGKGAPRGITIASRLIDDNADEFERQRRETIQRTVLLGAIALLACCMLVWSLS